MNYFDKLKKGEQEKAFPERRKVILDILPPRRAATTRPKLQSEVTSPAVQPPPPPPSPPPRANAMGKLRISDITSQDITSQTQAQRELATPSESHQPEDAELKVATWIPERVRKSQRARKILFWLGCAVFCAIVVIPTVFFPRFSITLYPRVNAVVVSPTEFIGDPERTEPSANDRAVPVLIVTVDREVSGTYEATGKKFVRERARGEVKIFNAFSSAPQQLVSGTRLQDPDGRIFRLESAITIPGASVENGKIVPTSITVPVVADAAGAESNIGPTEFRIPGFRGSPKYDGFYAKSEQVFSGGFEGEAKIVLTEDLRRASEDVTRRAIEEVRAELERKLPGGDDFVILDGARDAEIIEVIIPNPGERYDRFTARAKATGRLLIFRRSHVTSILADSLIDAERNPRAQVLAVQPELTFGAARFAANDSKRFRFEVAGELAYYQNPDLESLTATFKTSTPKKIEAYLRNRDEIGSFRMKRFPPWLWFIPGRSGGLQISVEPPQ